MQDRTRRAQFLCPVENAVKISNRTKFLTGSSSQNLRSDQFQPSPSFLLFII
jgi:hypothetical protein